MKDFLCALVAAGTFVVMETAAQAAPPVLRVATVAPAGSSFHKSLQALAAEWRKAPGGGVILDIYPGTQGGEAQISRRMRVGQIQGAMLTANGLGQIDRGATALQLMPMMFRDWGEVDYVREQLRPRLEKGLYDAGYVVMLWGDAGWVRFFSTGPIERPADLKGMRVYADGGDPGSLALMRDHYIPVPLDPDKILLGLRNGMIDAVPIPAFLANFMQVPGQAPYMLELRWAPIVGAVVLTRRAFDVLPAETREFMLESSREAGTKIRAQARIEDDLAVRAMRDKQGLRIVPFPAAVEAEWRSQVQRAYPKIRGAVVPEDTFDAVVAALDVYRRQAAAADSTGN